MIVDFPELGLGVDEKGRVYKKGKECNQWLNYVGYPTVKDKYHNNVLTHRLVAKAFLAPDPVRSIVNHKDGDKTNNNVSNLEWCTLGENVLHALRAGLHCNKETPIVGYNETTGQGYWFISQAKAKDYGFTQPNIAHCLAGRRAICKGFKWEYA